jgi:hypothetical protein
VTSRKTLNDDVGTGACGVPVTVKLTFRDTGAPLDAVITNVLAWPGTMVGGVKVAVVPGGSPDTDRAMSKSVAGPFGGAFDIDCA